jgi:lysophospholipase L1-like esterase
MTAGRATAVIAGLLLLAACQSGSPAVTQSQAASPAATSQASPSSGPALRVVTIGDSIPFGKDDCGGCTDFTTLVASALQQQTGETVEAENLSTHDNLTGARLLDRIRTDQAVRTAVSRADVVIVSIGRNDTPWNSTDDPCDGNNPDGVFNWTKYTGACVTQQAQRHGTQLDGILGEIQSLRAGKPTALRVLVDYNDVIGDPTVGVGADAPSIAVVEAFAQETCRVATLHRAVCVDVYHAFNGLQGTADAGGFLAGDHTHPNASGQGRISELLVAAGFAPIFPAS